MAAKRKRRGARGFGGHNNLAAAASARARAAAASLALGAGSAGGGSTGGAAGGAGGAGARYEGLCEAGVHRSTHVLPLPDALLAAALTAAGVAGVGAGLADASDNAGGARAANGGGAPVGAAGESDDDGDAAPLFSADEV